jgi:ubiquitin-activating enzyme E1
MLNEEQEILNTICHRNHVCFIGANTYGLAVRIFCDFGENFLVSDVDDSDPKSVLVGDISHVPFLSNKNV